MTGDEVLSNELVLRDLDGGVLTLTFNRPHRHNAWTGAMGAQYFDALTTAAADTDVRAIVVTGAGRSFCPGLDSQDLEAVVANNALARPTRPNTYALSIPKPIIAAINGGCAGLGFTHASCMDVRFAATGVKFAAAFARRGIPAEDSLSWILPRLIGGSRAADLLLSARIFTAEEAFAMGYVSRVVAPDDLLPTALAYARDIAEHVSPEALATTKMQIFDDWHRTQEESHHHAVAELMTVIRGGHDLDEGVRSLVEKRPPRFLGVSFVMPEAGAT